MKNNKLYASRKIIVFGKSKKQKQNSGNFLMNHTKKFASSLQLLLILHSSQDLLFFFVAMHSRWKDENASRVLVHKWK